MSPTGCATLARGARLDAVWENELGGVTFRTDDGRHIKHGPRNLETSFAGEAQRLEWAARYIVVPRVIEVGADETHEWLVTATLPGESAVAPRWVADPRRPSARSARGCARCTSAARATSAPSTGAWPRASRTRRGAASVFPDR